MRTRTFPALALDSIPAPGARGALTCVVLVAWALVGATGPGVAAPCAEPPVAVLNEMPRAPYPAGGSGEDVTVTAAPAPPSRGLGTRVAGAGAPTPRDFGFAIMGGPGMTRFGGRQRHDLALVVGHLGWTLPSMHGGLRTTGPWHVALEASLGGQTRPLPRDFFGVTPIVRYEWPARGPWHPFVAAGVGASYTNIRQPDLSTRFQFNDQFGAGLRRELSPFASLVLECRWIHLSNAGLEMPNNGTNTLAFRIGYRHARREPL